MYRDVWWGSFASKSPRTKLKYGAERSQFWLFTIFNFPCANFLGSDTAFLPEERKERNMNYTTKQPNARSFHMAISVCSWPLLSTLRSCLGNLVVM